ncbi:MAG: phage holin family protein [Acidimicrobiales bacterium]
MKRLLVLWVISTVALLVLPAIFGDVSIDNWTTAAIAAVVIGIVNVSIGPVLKFIALPVRWLTVGLFTLVINGFLLLLVSKVVPGFKIDGFGTAILAAVVYSVVTWLGGQILLRDDD